MCKQLSCYKTFLGEIYTENGKLLEKLNIIINISISV